MLNAKCYILIVTRKSTIWILGIIAVAAILLKIGHCSYDQLGKALTMEGITETITAKFTKVKHITTSDLAGWLNQPDKKKSTLLIDSRAAEEFEVSHLEGAQNLLTTEEVKSYLTTLTTPPERIVVYCSVGYRSAELATQIQDAKITHIPIQNLLGSIFSWSNEGRRLVKDNETPTTKVHPYNKKWSRLLKLEHRAKTSN